MYIYITQYAKAVYDSQNNFSKFAGKKNSYAAHQCLETIMMYTRYNLIYTHMFTSAYN